MGVDQPKPRDLSERLFRAGIRPEDLLEWFIRSTGPGGQNVNKTSTCVVLRHIPTGIEVRCQAERSQARNREIAREILLARLEAERARRKLEQDADRARRRAQKRRRGRATQERLIESKRRAGRKKSLRRHLKSGDTE